MASIHVRGTAANGSTLQRAGRYFVCPALAGSLTASYLANSTLYKSPPTLSTLRIWAPFRPFENRGVHFLI
jgi:hypothetical protein